MIVTVTVNPSVDRALEVEGLTRGAVLRAHSSHTDPGGKGVNVSRALAANGLRSRAVLPSGGPEGAQLAALLAGRGVEVTTVPIAGATRVNISVTEPDGTVTKFNEPGPRLGEDELRRVVEAARAAVVGAEWAVLAGSVPPGVPDDFYARLLERLRADDGDRDRDGDGDGDGDGDERPAVSGGAPATRTRVAVDTSGAPFVSALPARPDLVKPNREELGAAIGRPLTTLGEVVDAARELCHRGARNVLASLGADGAVLVSATDAVYGRAPVGAVRSAVGAGDALLAGFLAGGGEGPDALAEALAWGAAAATLPGSQMPEPRHIDRGVVKLYDHLDPHLILSERS
ncbi:1-phosphofructokinase family hexose kinase [Allostreptomyces psammosilenae]|uniref:1-phosphofructokinase n=1 Tax=Allostreptomyces psammosilenae TaxID=1892865 RepID=A0A852ZTB6_9ACTN|nr:1-phosphofructokinase family hexose kinase [Allostreptomyces psammosilenae]NYI05653.1 1-phosphofructokinase [Allostreptomyces psammosilenae]